MAGLFDAELPSEVAAWALLVKSVARALGYDTRLTPRIALSEVLDEATKDLEAVALPKEMVGLGKHPRGPRQQTTADLRG